MQNHPKIENRSKIVLSQHSEEREKKKRGGVSLFRMLHNYKPLALNMFYDIRQNVEFFGRSMMFYCSDLRMLSSTKDHK